MEKMIVKLLAVHENRPDLVDKLLALIRQQQPPDNTNWEKWLYKQWENKTLEPDYAYLDLLTYEY